MVQINFGSLWDEEEDEEGIDRSQPITPAFAPEEPPPAPDPLAVPEQLDIGGYTGANQEAEDSILSYQHRKQMVDSGAVSGDMITDIVGPLPGDIGMDEAGAITGAIPLAGHTLARVIGAPIMGLGEIVGVVPDGVSQKIKEDFERERLQYISGGDTALGMNIRAGMSGVMEAGAEIIPLSKAKWMGKVGQAAVTGVNRMARTAGITGKTLTAAEKFAYRAAPAAFEGSLWGLGEAADQPWEGRVKAATLGAVFGGSMAAASGYAAASKVNKAMESKFDKLPDYLSPEMKESVLAGELSIEDAAARSVNAKQPESVPDQSAALRNYEGDNLPGNRAGLSPREAFDIRESGEHGPSLMDVVNMKDELEIAQKRDIFGGANRGETVYRRAQKGQPVTVYAPTHSTAILPGATVGYSRTQAKKIPGGATGEIGKIDIMPDELIPTGKGRFEWIPKDVDSSLKKVREQDPNSIFSPQEIQSIAPETQNLINTRAGQITDALTPEIRKPSKYNVRNRFVDWMKQKYVSNMMSFGEFKHAAKYFDNPATKKWVSYTLPRYMEKIPHEKNRIMFHAERVKRTLDKEVRDFALNSGRTVEDIGKQLTEVRTKRRNVELDIEDIRIEGLEADMATAERHLANASNPKTIEKRTREIADIRKELSATHREISEYLNRVRKEYKALPQTLRDAYRDSSRFVNKLTDELEGEGVIGKGERDGFKSNMNQYVHVSHAKHEQKDWARRVEDSAQWTETESWFRRSFGAESDLPPVDQWSDGKILATMLDIATHKESAGFFGRAASPEGTKQHLGIAQRRSKISAPIRQLMGLHDDFVKDVFPRTVGLMTHDLVTTKVREQMLKEGLRSGAFSAQPLGRAAHPVTLNKTRTAKSGQGKLDTMYKRGELNVPDDQFAESVVYTDKELADLLNGVTEPDAGGVLKALNGLIKWGKIGYSPQTQIRNGWSGVIMTMANGVLNPLSYKKAPALWLDIFSGGLAERGSKGALVSKFVGTVSKDLDDLYRLGIISPGTQAGDLTTWRKDVTKTINDAAPLPGGKVKTAVRYINDAVVKGYETTDSMFRALNYYSELDNLSAAVGTGKKAISAKKILKEIYGTSDLKDVAAERALQTYQTYSRTPAIGRKLSRSTLSSAFATFHIEAPRNLQNNVKVALENWQIGKATGNKAFKQMARKRILGMMTSLTMLQTYKAYKNRSNGIDREKDEAFRRTFAYDFAKNNELIYEDLTYDPETGSRIVHFKDLSYLQPQQMLGQSINVMTRGDLTFEDKLKELASSFSDLYLGWELMTGAAVEQITNKQLRGSPVGALLTGRGAEAELYNPEDPGTEKAKKRFLAAYNKLAPGLAVFAMRTVRSQVAFFDPRDPERFDPEREMWAQATGQRVIPADLHRGFQNRVYQFSERKSKMSSSVNSAARKVEAGGPVALLDNAERNAYRSWEESYSDMKDHVESARTWGFSDSEIEDLFRNKRTGRTIIRADIMEALLVGDDVSWWEVKERPEVTPVTMD